jgi:hypothetical protein
MAQYQHLPIYKQTYDLLVRVTEITRGYPRDFKRAHHQMRRRPENLPASINSYFGLMRHANAYRQRQRLGAKARLAGLNPNPALTKVTPCNT